MTDTSSLPTAAAVLPRTRRRTPVRARPRGGASGRRPSVSMTVVMVLFAAYALLPLLWMVINSTKTYEGLLGSFGLWFGPEFALFDNIVQVLTRNDGIYLRWFANTVLYVVLGAGGATLLATLGGYGMAKYDFPGKRAVFAVVLGAIAIPGTALAVPTFLMFSSLGITNTMASVIVPALASPFSFYLMWIFARDIPTEVIEAARMDGSGELRTFFRISLPMMAPGVVTVFLFDLVATWNNYFLPLIMLRSQDLFPLSVGLQAWNLEAQGIQGGAVYHLVITASLLTVIPIVVVFLLLQRYWQNGLNAGSVKG
jgi:multiple sugar transport system permease protein